MRCVECMFFHRFDMRTSPSGIVCAKHIPDAQPIDSSRGCAQGLPKSKGSPIWNRGGGACQWNSQERKTCGS